MNELILVKSENFGQIQCDFWQNKQNSIFMTINQLAQALGYADRSGIQKIVDRNQYLKEKEFSVQDKLSSTDGKFYNTRVFTEDGIYEVTFLAGTERAKEFRTWVRSVLKALRKGQAKIIPATEEKKKLADAKYNNSIVRKANIFIKLADRPELPQAYKQILYSQAAAIIAGKPLLPLPEAERKTYSAEEIGDMIGISPNKVGRLTNAHNLKTEQYGKLFHDKSRYSAKEVETFRYYEEIIPVLRELI